MSRLENLQSRISDQGKTILSFTADIVEWTADKNLAVAGDIADFAVKQLRLPVKAKDFAGYRGKVRSSLSDFGTVMKSHGEDIIAKLREVPADVRDAFQAEEKPVRKPVVRKPAASKAAVRKPVAKKPAARKTAVRKPAKKVVTTTPVAEKAA